MREIKSFVASTPGPRKFLEHPIDLGKSRSYIEPKKSTSEQTYLTFATSVLASIKAISVVPSDSDKTDVGRKKTDVRWVGFYPLGKNTSKQTCRRQAY
jgi:hypothetical protein